jgi:two-component system chemotaxis sensor kinase CheA
MYIEDAELREIYKTVTPERLQKLEAGLMRLEKQPGDAATLEEFLREAHTLKGDSRMLGVTDVETLVHQIEDSIASVKRGETILNHDLCDRIYHGLDAIRKLVKEAVTGEASGVNTFLILAQLMGAQSNGNKSENGTDSHPAAVVELDQSLNVATVPEKPALSPQAPKQIVTASSQDLDTIRVDSDKLDALMRQTGELSITKLRIARRATEIEEILKLYEDWSRDTIVNRSTLKQLERESHNGHLKPVQDFWRRAENRLERLGNLIGQLKSEAAEDSASLEGITNELESGIQNLRLLPLSTIFNPFQRMVRDLAKHQGKEVNLIIEGGETRADKRILEDMKDPLLHIIRNAIDHGIETPEERQSKSKPRTATIRLRGYQSGGNIGIEIVDDGCGLELESIKRSAVRRGVCSEEELAKMTTEQIRSLIFMPGFSTRTEVTELSGRGVGLDVVRANVDRLKGTIQLESSPGMGCEFRILVSANVAIAPVLLVEVAQTAYAIPVESVETIDFLLLFREQGTGNRE